MTEVTLTNGTTVRLHANISVMLKREKAMQNPDVKDNTVLLTSLVILAMIQAADKDTTMTIDDILNLDNYADFRALDQAALTEFNRLMGTAAPVPSASADGEDESDQHPNL